MRNRKRPTMTTWLTSLALALLMCTGVLVGDKSHAEGRRGHQSRSRAKLSDDLR